MLKKLICIISAIVIVGVSCKKEGCWDCEITRMDGSKYQDVICNDSDYPPQVYDNNNNQLQADCTKR